MLTTDVRGFVKWLARDYDAIRSRLRAQRLIAKESRLRNSSSDVGTVDAGPLDGADVLPAPPFASFCGVKSPSFSDLAFLS